MPAYWRRKKEEINLETGVGEIIAVFEHDMGFRVDLLHGQNQPLHKRFPLLIRKGLGHQRSKMHDDRIRFPANLPAISGRL